MIFHHKNYVSISAAATIFCESSGELDPVLGRCGNCDWNGTSVHFLPEIIIQLCGVTLVRYHDLAWKIAGKKVYMFSCL